MYSCSVSWSSLHYTVLMFLCLVLNCWSQICFFSQNGEPRHTKMFEYARFVWGSPTMCIVLQSSHQWKPETREAEWTCDKVPSANASQTSRKFSTLGKPSADCGVWDNWTCVARTVGCHQSFVRSVVSNTKDTVVSHSWWRFYFTWTVIMVGKLW